MADIDWEEINAKLPYARTEVFISFNLKLKNR